MSFFSNLFKAATPENAIMVREASVPGVPSSTMPPEPPKVQGGDYQERIAYVRGPEQALVEIGRASCRERVCLRV